LIFAIDLLFPNTKLTPFLNLEEGSSELPFDLEAAIKNPNDLKNFGVLIGRDIMSKWVVVWNGLASSVNVSD